MNAVSGAQQTTPPNMASIAHIGRLLEVNGMMSGGFSLASKKRAPSKTSDTAAAKEKHITNKANCLVTNNCNGGNCVRGCGASVK